MANATPRIMILHATGSNRDREAAFACELAGGAPEIVHVNQVATGERRLLDAQMLVLPGGFSYGDDLGAGKLWAVALRYRLGDELQAFVDSGRPVLGICNGFQVLVKAGLLPGSDRVESGPWLAGSEDRREWSVEGSGTVQQVTLTRNDSARFECRWVTLHPQSGSPCVFTQGLDQAILCPVAHGEGKFVAQDEETLARIEQQGLVALRYARPQGATAPSPADETNGAGYPWNPNGSQADIAGICNPQGTIFGLMPHPEDHILPEQHPLRHRGEHGLFGLPLFVNGVRYAGSL
jgi:phosphoribosylformylglycinamidine synthase subunit PurQ / glutaminase